MWVILYLCFHLNKDTISQVYFQTMALVLTYAILCFSGRILWFDNIVQPLAIYFLEMYQEFDAMSIVNVDQ